MHLAIHEKEYLCVELAIFLPKSLNSEEDSVFTSMTRADSSEIMWNMENELEPFPTPAGTTKVILFQGAVPFTSLMDVFTQKGLAAQNALKLSWSRLGASYDSKSPKMDPKPGQRTEYIMMRGPRGKGQCQVAISSLNSSEEDESKKNRTLTDRLKGVAGAMKSYILNDKRSDELLGNASNGLQASMTYVNIPWNSIVCDLLEYAKTTRAQDASASTE